jgi:flagellar basal-body rod protein FlgC
MDYQFAFAISKTGMALQQLRLDVATLNLAQVNLPAQAGAPVYRARHVVASEAAAAPAGLAGPEAMFANAWGQAQRALGGTRFVVAEGAAQPPRQVQDPGHPQADARGFVAYPAIDHNTEMLNLMTAVRAYEANVMALNAAKTMAQRALEIGGNA